ncbi:MAG: iron-containing alcohol dehydrogenase [Christensenellales bacterium]
MPLQRSFIRFSTRVEFGAGMLDKLGAIAAEFGDRAYCIFDPFFQNSETALRTLRVLHAAGIQTIENYDVRPNPRAADMDTKAAECVEKRCNLVIALGGGSCIDIGKAVAAVAANGRSIWDYATVENRHSEEITVPPLPLIAVPTTSGTGSEATIYSVVTNPAIQRKCAVRSFYMYPAVALVDPALMMLMPPMLTALTGIDTFAHGYESYTNKNATLFSRTLALECMKLFAENIEECCSHGGSLQARANMAYASLLGGMAIAHCPTTIGHVLGQCLSGWTDAPHGGSLACCIEQLIRWTLPDGMADLSRIARLFSVDLYAVSDEESARRLPDILSGLFERILGKRVTMKTYGMKDEHAEEFAGFVYQNYQRDMSNYLKAPSAEDIVFLVQKSM